MREWLRYDGRESLRYNSSDSSVSASHLYNYSHLQYSLVTRGGLGKGRPTGGEGDALIG